MQRLDDVLRRWPWSAAATFVGLTWIAYFWSVWMAGGVAQRSSFDVAGLTGGGYYVTGALVAPAIIRDHEWERLVSSIFLHGGLLHLILNSAAILQLGRILELFSTRERCWFTLLVSGLCGSLVTVLWSLVVGPKGLTIGASGAGCGVGAALIVLSRGVDALDEFRKQLITWVGVMLAMGLIPIISGTGHLGGALGGALAGVLIRRRGTMVVRRDRFAAALRVATVALSLVFAAALALTAVRTLERKARIADLAASVDEIHIWLDEGKVTDLAGWKGRIGRLELPSIMDETRQQLVALAQWLALADGGTVSQEAAENAREAIQGIRWW